MINPRLLIVDALNLFIRNFVVDPSLSSVGLPIGGTKGFLKSLQKVCREIEPTHLFVVWDGKGGSSKRKAMDANYKEGRAPIRLNRNDHNLSADQEQINKVFQIERTMEYLNHLPIPQFSIEDVEADDVIAFITKMDLFAGIPKFILSNDKDFLQLCDKETLVIRPVQKKIMNVPRVLEEYSIHPNNLALARSIAGDSSDNLPGVRGVGLKTIAKKFPMFAEETLINFDKLYEVCEINKGKAVVFSSILAGKREIESNYRLMQLYTTSLSAHNAHAVRSAFKHFRPDFNQTEMIKMFAKDGFLDYNWSSFTERMKVLSTHFHKTI